ncbi:MAG: SURF1 family protein [Paracoccaceae bacterium]
MRSWLFLLTFGLAGAAVLIGLGVWQMQRLAWKHGVLAQIDSRIAAPPVAVPQSPDPEADKYLPVLAAGEILQGEAHVLVSIKDVGAGYRIIAPYLLPGGRRILLDRGFIGISAKDMPRSIGPIEVTGNLHWPKETDKYTPEPDLETNTWFARDVAALALSLDTLPVLLIARTTSESDPSVTPLPVDSAGIPNDHLQYAITWFSLAFIWLVMTGFFLRGSRAKTEG